MGYLASLSKHNLNMSIWSPQPPPSLPPSGGIDLLLSIHQTKINQNLLLMTAVTESAPTE